MIRFYDQSCQFSTCISKPSVTPATHKILINSISSAVSSDTVERRRSTYYGMLRELFRNTSNIMTTPLTQTRITGMSDKSSSGTIPERGERLTCNIANLMNPHVSDHKRTLINYSRLE